MVVNLVAEVAPDHTGKAEDATLQGYHWCRIQDMPICLGFL
jgi:hypothetical protein